MYGGGRAGACLVAKTYTNITKFTFMDNELIASEIREQLFITCGAVKVRGGVLVKKLLKSLLTYISSILSKVPSLGKDYK